MDLQSLTKDELRALCADPGSHPGVLKQIADEFPDLAGLAHSNPSWSETEAEAIEADAASRPSPVPPPTPGNVPPSEATMPPPPVGAVPPPPPPFPGAPAPMAPATPAWAAVLGKTLAVTWRRIAAIVGISIGAGLLSSALVVLVVVVFPTLIPAVSGAWGAAMEKTGPGLVMQLIMACYAMANLATVDLHSTQGSILGSTPGVTVSIYMVPWLVTTVIVVAAWVSAKKLGPRHLTRWYRLAWAGIVGLAYTILATILTALIPVFYVVDHAAVNATAVGLWPFLCGWVLVALGTFAGLSDTGLAFFRRPWVAAAASGLGFVVVASTISVLGVSAYLAFVAPQYLSVVPWIGPIAGWWMVSMGMGASAGFSGVHNSGYLPNGYNLAIWSGQLPPWLWLALLATMLLVLCAGVIYAGLTRPDVHTWYRLPAAWTVVGLLFEVFFTFMLRVQGTGADGVYWGGGAPYAFLLMGVWAGLAAVGAHFLAPPLLHLLPPALRAGLAPAGLPPMMPGMPVMPMAAAVPPPLVVASVPPVVPSEDAPSKDSEPTKVYESGEFANDTVVINTSPSQWTAASAPSASAPLVPVVAAAPNAAMMAPISAPAKPAKMSTRAKVAVFSGLGTLALLIVVIAVASWAKSSYYSPQDKVMQFMSALQAGQAGQAAKLANLNTDQPLLTDSVYVAATDRPSQAAISSVHVTGDTAVVTVAYTRAGEAQSATFSLNRTGTDWLIMDRWEIVDGAPTSTMKVAWPSAMGDRVVVVNNVEIPNLRGSEQTFTVFPGSYNVALKADANFEGEQTRWVSTDDESVWFEAKPTAALQQAMIAAVRTKVNECAKSTLAYPVGCPFAAAWDSSSSSSYTGVSYRIVTQPTMTVAGATEDGDGWAVSTGGGSRGTVSMNYTWTGYFSNTPYTDQRRTFTVEAVVVIENGAPVVRSLSGSTGY